MCFFLCTLVVVVQVKILDIITIPKCERRELQDASSLSMIIFLVGGEENEGRTFYTSSLPPLGKSTDLTPLLKISEREKLGSIARKKKAKRRRESQDPFCFPHPLSPSPCSEKAAHIQTSLVKQFSFVAGVREDTEAFVAHTIFQTYVET